MINKHFQWNFLMFESFNTLHCIKIRSTITQVTKSTLLIAINNVWI